MPKLKIEHLGPIDNLEFDVENFNLIIGEQATGKSTIAKSIYFFRSIKDLIIKYLCNLYTDKSGQRDIIIDIRREMKSLFVSVFGYSWDQDDRLLLSYEYTGDIKIEISIHCKNQ
ncbi:MAG: AAA family ATPase [Oscillospiraceae bacterium]|nr:AAA family ATPase [Oscillospiraceae bacterium]